MSIELYLTIRIYLSNCIFLIIFLIILFNKNKNSHLTFSFINLFLNENSSFLLLLNGLFNDPEGELGTSKKGLPVENYASNIASLMSKIVTLSKEEIRVRKQKHSSRKIGRTLRSLESTHIASIAISVKINDNNIFFNGCKFFRIFSQ